jgi:YidC/Oxa1 family membrane protein insertase
MDRSQITGLILLAILFTVYYAFFLPEPAPRIPPGTAQEELVRPDTETRRAPEFIGPTDTPGRVDRDTLHLQEQQIRYGIFAPALEGERREIVIENEVMRVSFNSQGGEVQRVELKGFEAYGGHPLVLIDENSSIFESFLNVDGRQVDIAQLFFTTDAQNQVLQNGDTAVVTFTMNLAQGRTITRRYVMDDQSYQIRGQINLSGFEGIITDNRLTYRWTDRIRLQDRRIEEVRAKTTINYYAGGSFDDLKENSELEEERVTTPVKWAAFKQKFFTAAIIADGHFNSGHFRTVMDRQDTTTVKVAEMMLEMPLTTDEGNSLGYRYYFGPNNFKILKRVEDSFERNIYLGWPPVNFINRYLIIPVFHFLERYVANYGIIILLLTIFIRIIISPLTYKSHLSMAKTKILKPELDTIKEKYKDDAQKAQSEQMQLYSKAGVNPLSGCIPMLLQMPILFAMFYFFPNSIELRHESFLWADDLSTYDSIISWSGNIPILSTLYGNHVSLFTILMTLSTILYTWSNNQLTSVQGPMKTMGYFMPVIFMFVLNSFSAALTYYYFLSNIISFVQQAIIKRFVNEDKIKVIMEENKLKYKTGKKSKFQVKLEEAMKAKAETTATKPNVKGTRKK